MTDTQHTPLPWETEPEMINRALGPEHQERIYATDPGPENDFTIAIVQDVDKPTRKANAAYIVKACNAHEGLVKALREIRDLEPQDLGEIRDEWSEARCSHEVQDIAGRVLAGLEE